MSKSVLFIVPYPLHVAPSQRFRVELYEPILQAHDIKYEIVSFMDSTTWNIIFKPGNQFKKVSATIKGFLRRIGHVIKAINYDYVFIHREAAPLGPPIFEWIIAKLLRKKIIYDFDDAIWIPNISKANKMAAALKAFWKVPYICKWSHTVTAGNEYLRNYASQFSSNAIILPTCVDVVRKHNKIKQHSNHKPVVGWTGSHSTISYLYDIVPLLNELREQYEFTFLVIADKKPELEMSDWQFVPWNETTETDDLLKMDIGVMPLKPDQWSEGKCGFKLIQYLSCGIPALASPVGVNKQIIEEGKNGFLCGTNEEWKQALIQLITNPELRKDFGENGRKKIVQEYSIQSQEEKFVNLFK